MEYRDWSPLYDALRTEFGFRWEEERAAADLLEAELPESARWEPLRRIGERLRGRDVVVVGLAPGAGPPPVWRLSPAAGPVVLVAADGATEVCLGAGLVPAVITTDLDGPVPSEITANRRGSLAVIHAHGDNRPALEEWVPQFPGELAGSWAGPPRAGLIDVGGFTDGDRAAFLAEHVGARRILLWGFDFRSVDETEPSARARKQAKLRWAQELLSRLSARAPGRIFEWRRDGSIALYGEAPSSDASTR